MIGPNYKPGPPSIRKSGIFIDLNWFNEWRKTHELSEAERNYLNAIIVSQSICPRAVTIQNEEWARKILGLE